MPFHLLTFEGRGILELTAVTYVKNKYIVFSNHYSNNSLCTQTFTPIWSKLV